MKKIIATISIVWGISLIGALSGTGAGSCSAYGQTVTDGRWYMEGFVRGVNEELPQEMIIFTLRSAEIKDNTVRFFLDISLPDALDDLYEALNEKKLELLGVFCGSLANTCRMLAASELDVEYVLTDKNTNAAKSIVIKSAEIKENLDSIIESISSRHVEIEEIPIEELVENLKKTLPFDMGEGVALVDVKIEDNNLMCVTNVEDAEVIKEMNEVMSLGEGLVKMMLMKSYLNDVGSKTMIKSLKASNMGFAFIFRSEKTEDKCEIIFSPEELKEIEAE